MRKLQAAWGSLALALALGACDEAADPLAPPPVEEPRAPVALAVSGQGVVPERYTAEVAVAGDWAYTSTWGTRAGTRGNVVKIWNVSGAVTLVDSLVIEAVGTTGDVQVSPDGRLLMVATEHVSPGAIVLFERADPARPTLLARFSSAHTAPGVHTAKFGVVNGTLYGFLSVDPNGTSPAKLVIVDLSDPAAPREVWAQPMGRPYVHDVFVRDGLLLTALWDDGLSIWDIGGGGRGGSPAAPVLLSNLRTATGDIHNIWWFHDAKTGSKRYVFLGEEGPGNGESPGSVSAQASGDVHAVDISDLTQPREVAIFAVPGAGTHNFTADEQNGYLYAAYYNGGVRVIDARGDLGSCTAAQRTTAGLCDLRLMGREAGFGLTTGSYVWGVAFQGGQVYASDMRSGLYRLDARALTR